jgi:2'-phosphotransferase
MTTHSITLISGARASSEIFIHIDIHKAMSAGITFFLSANGVVLTEGDGRGFLDPQFFSRVENAKGVALPGWDGITASEVVVEATEVNL